MVQQMTGKPLKGLLLAALLLVTADTVRADAPHAETTAYPAYAEVLQVRSVSQPVRSQSPVRRCTWETLPDRVSYDRRYGERRVIERRAKRCRTIYETRTSTRVTGYDVTLRYNGETFTRRMSVRPGDRVPVTIEISPAG